MKRFWIVGMKIVGWLAFLGIIGVGIFAAINADSVTTGIIIGVGSFILAFITVGMFMITINMACDINRIKEIQEGRR